MPFGSGLGLTYRMAVWEAMTIQSQLASARVTSFRTAPVQTLKLTWHSVRSPSKRKLLFAINGANKEEGAPTRLPQDAPRIFLERLANETPDGSEKPPAPRRQCWTSRRTSSKQDCRRPGSSREQPWRKRSQAKPACLETAPQLVLFVSVVLQADGFVVC